MRLATQRAGSYAQLIITFKDKLHGSEFDFGRRRTSKTSDPIEHAYKTELNLPNSSMLD
jgi:hypothetical protein